MRCCENCGQLRTCFSLETVRKGAIVASVTLAVTTALFAYGVFSSCSDPASVLSILSTAKDELCERQFTQAVVSAVGTVVTTAIAFFAKRDKKVDLQTQPLRQRSDSTRSGSTRFKREMELRASGSLLRNSSDSFLAKHL